MVLALKKTQGLTKLFRRKIRKRHRKSSNLTFFLTREKTTTFGVFLHTFFFVEHVFRKFFLTARALIGSCWVCVCVCRPRSLFAGFLVLVALLFLYLIPPLLLLPTFSHGRQAAALLLQLGGLGQEDLHRLVGLSVDQHSDTGSYDERKYVGKDECVDHFAAEEGGGGGGGRLLLLGARHTGQIRARAAHRALAREPPVLGRADGGCAGPVPHEVGHAGLRLLQPVDVDPLQLLREVSQVRHLRSGTVRRRLGRSAAGGGRVAPGAGLAHQGRGDRGHAGTGPAGGLALRLPEHAHVVVIAAKGGRGGGRKPPRR